jgi:putative two-component system response regulator
VNVDQKTILLVDDSPEILDVLKFILKPHYAIKVATRGALALKLAAGAGAGIDLILLDVMLPDMEGYEVCRLLKADERTRHIPVIFVTARSDPSDEAHGFAIGAEDYIVKPVSAPVVLARVATHLALNDRSRLLEQLVRQRTSMLEQRTRELEETRLQILRRLGRATEFRDNETGMHVLRMSQYVGLLARRIGLSTAEVETMDHAALMHDIGKIGIPDHILRKPDSLTTEEYDIVKTHCQIGADIIGFHESPLLSTCRTVALTHHERWDGQGYPNHLSGTDIPLAGRLTAIADIFDALTSWRPYKTAWNLDRAMQEIDAQCGHALDPVLGATFIGLRPDLERVIAAYPDSASLH